MNRTKIKNIGVSLNLKCNMNCSYCFQKDTARKVEQIDNLEDKIIPILDKLYLNDIVTINFIGGEAMIMQDKLIKCIKKFKKYEREHDVKFKYLLKTNGTNAKDLVTLIDNNIIDPFVCISYDGKDSDRTYIDINEFKPLLKYRDRVAIHIALSKKSAKNMYNTVKELSDIGFKNFEYYFLYTDPIYEDENYINDFSNNLEKIVKLHCDGTIDLYNYTEAYRKKKLFDKTGKFVKGMSCNDIHNIDILSDGTFAVCGFLNIYAQRNDPNVLDENSSIEDIEKSCTFLKDFYKDLHCPSDKCGNYQCVECSLYSERYRSIEQQCKMRTIERKIFEKYMKL